MNEANYNIFTVNINYNLNSCTGLLTYSKVRPEILQASQFAYMLEIGKLEKPNIWHSENTRNNLDEGGVLFKQQAETN